MELYHKKINTRNKKENKKYEDITTLINKK